ncbi:MAG: hypothetical protein PHU62_00395 [Bacteroidales bacterium]|nr:hypothetical protein [Bacteroidales bacterium]MDD3151372.1 hypothetical protein [Bacteroidales bacterium]MDD4633028.1 hypothetical protein [Bacteroidales bacterium]
MKKFLFLFVILSMSTTWSLAQKAQDEMLDFNKTKIQGFSIALPNVNLDAAENALIQRLVKAGGLQKSKSQSGYTSYLNQNYPFFGEQKFDIFTKVIETGKKSAKTTTLYVIVTQGNNNAITTKNSPEVAERVKNFMNEFSDYVAEFEGNKKIVEANNAITKLTKERDGYIADKEKLQKQISALDQKITDKNAEIQKEQANLNEIKANMSPNKVVPNAIENANPAGNNTPVGNVETPERK